MRKIAHAKAALLLAASVFAGPLAFPQATYALSVEDVYADDTGTGEKTEYTIEFEIDKSLSPGDEIVVKFPSGFKVDKNLDEGDVELEDEDGDEYDIESVDVSGNTITIELDDKISKNTLLILRIDNITNPKSKGDYKISVKTSEENSFKSEEISIGKSSSSKSSRFDVSLGTANAGEVTTIRLGKINLDSKLREGKYVYVTFPTKDMLPSSISRDNVKINGERVKKVVVSSSNVLRLEIPEDVDGDKTMLLEIAKAAGVKNPSEAGKSYTFEVEYDKDTYRSEAFEIKGSTVISGSAFDVTLADSNPGARTSYTLDLQLSSKVSAGTGVQVDFPSVEMVPPIISNSHVTVNGSSVSNLGVNGSRVTFRLPTGFTSTDKLTIRFAQEAYLINPRTAGSYEIQVKVGNTTYRSKKFQISSASVPVNNSAATISLGRNTASTPTGMQVNIQALGAPLGGKKDFLEIVLPVGFSVPAYVPANSVTVNGVAASYVGVRGQNLVIYPSQDIPANTAVQVAIAESASIVNPATAGTYSISVYTSEQQGILFARPVQIVALNGVGFRANVASYTKNGQTHSLAVAPFILNGTTMMPASFFRDGLGMSVTWDKTSARIVSGNTTMQFKVGSKVATVNGQNVTMAEAVQLRGNMPVIPLRFVAERTGYKIIFVNGIYTVYR